MPTRRTVLATLGAAACLPLAAGAPLVAQGDPRADSAGFSFDLRRHFAEPVTIAAIDVLRLDGESLIRCTAADGAVGIIPAHEKLTDFLSLLKELVRPFFINKDARDLPELVEGVYLEERNYKYAGMPFWNAVANIELCLLDLLGKQAGLPSGRLFGEFRRTQLPVYLSRFDRDTTAQQEVAAAARDLARTGATAVKFKTGRRMSNSPQQTRRDIAMVALARETFGNGVAIYLDANGSYRTAAEAIRIGREFERLGASFLEEPCPWEDFAATKQVADALEMTIAGGEQDSSLPKFRWLIENQALDLVQPDLFYNGGLIRALRVAQLAAAAGLPITPHSPRVGLPAAPTLHLMALVPNPGPHMEYKTSPEIQNGTVRVPDATGFGLEYDAPRFARAEVIA